MTKNTLKFKILAPLAVCAVTAFSSVALAQGDNQQPTIPALIPVAEPCMHVHSSTSFTFLGQSFEVERMEKAGYVWYKGGWTTPECAPIEDTSKKRTSNPSTPSR